MYCFKKDLIIPDSHNFLTTFKCRINNIPVYFNINFIEEVDGISFFIATVYKKMEYSQRFCLKTKDKTKFHNFLLEIIRTYYV